MKKSGFSLNPFLTLGVLFLATALMLIYTVDISVTDEAGVREELPETLGDTWVGRDVLFCQDPKCGRSWLTDDLTPDGEGEYHCPTNWQGEACGGELLGMSLGEKLILPRDTVIMKKQYTHTGDPENTVFTSVVLSGKDRTSIHRPENCLDAQGNIIEQSKMLEVPLDNGGTLKVQVLMLYKKHNGQHVRHSYYAYFFIGKDRVTHLHFERALWMSLDRVFRNVAHRWAYIAVFGERSPFDDDDFEAEIREVIGKLYPQISLLEEP